MSTGFGWQTVVDAEVARCRARRDRVLAHPDLAMRLTQQPINFAHPEQWNGYIAPAQIERGGQMIDNPSPVRRALIQLCNDVLAAERDRAINPPDDPPAWSSDEQPDPAAESSDSTILTPSSPGSVTTKQLQRLHIMFGEIGVVDRDHKLDFCESTISRRVESTKDLSRNEAAQVMDAIHRIAYPEES